MQENNQAMGGYGYQDDEVSQGSGMKFGLNQGAIRLVKFEWIPNGGKDGAEQEALDIVFQYGERNMNYRKFPITRAYDKNNGGAEVTDPQHPSFKEAQAELSAVIVHILGCFVDRDTIKTAFSRPISSFKDYCKICEGLLPKDFASKDLDVFLQWQWQISGERDKTYLELPKHMKQGKWLVPSTNTDWKEVRTSKLLKYVDANNEANVHPFQRGEWFLNNNNASQQKTGSENPAPGVPSADGASASAW